MQDGAESSPGAATEEPLPLPIMAPHRRRGASLILLVALPAFLLGGALAGWLVWLGHLDIVLPERTAEESARIAEGSRQQGSMKAAQSADALGAERSEADLGNMETRLALLEDRFSRIGLQANAAGANASRAEALLVALAARRRIDQGEPLGYIEDQLKLRFGGAQPEAVQTIIAAAGTPITLYLLSSRLEAAAPALAGVQTDESTWEKIKRELSSLFVVRRTPLPTAKPLERVERAQILLKAGRIEDAIAEIERLPGAEKAQDWIAAARRYDAAQRALDLIETAAMLEPQRLRDDSGAKVDQPSPLVPPPHKAATAN